MANRVQLNDFDMGAHRVVNIRTPDEPDDAANKGYVDATAAAIEAEATQARYDAAAAIIEAAEANSTANNASAGAATAIEEAANAGSAAQAAQDEAAAAILAAGAAEAVSQSAQQDAAQAIELANAKADVVSGPAPPADPSVDDVWIDTGNDSKVFVWGGSEWQHVSAFVPPSSITGLEISDFAMTVKKLNTSTHMIY